MIYNLDDCIKEYQNSLNEMSDMVLKLESISIRMEYIANYRKEQCQPSYNIKQILEKFATALANTYIYYNQFLKEKQQEIKNGKTKI